MARFALCFLGLLLVASYASAISLEELCKDTYEVGYCVRLLKPTVTKSTNFNSVAWRKRVLNRALARDLIAIRFMISQGYNVPEEDTTTLKSCVHRLDISKKLIKEVFAQYGTKEFELHKNDFLAKLDDASANQNECYDALEDAAGIMKEVRVHANEALMASRIAKDIITG